VIASLRDVGFLDLVILRLAARDQDERHGRRFFHMSTGKFRITAGRWHAVSVATNGECCAAASGLHKMRFLSAEAPVIPLMGCSRPDACRCFYKHHEDRRGQLRRREEITGLRAKVRVEEERRQGRDRRETDFW
jgi:hypothetical protein